MGSLRCVIIGSQRIASKFDSHCVSYAFYFVLSLLNDGVLVLVQI